MAAEKRMAFRGLFVGIDRYLSTDINELSCARRDAVALEALFADTLGGTSTLLVDQDATRARLQTEFEALEGCAPEDTVVICFSGHGSETHELVTHDTQIDDLAATAIPLELIEQWFSRIPARRLVFFLDCCFSGGIGAKVLKVEARPRDLRSVEMKLDHLAGQGRIIFTASNAHEPAYEHNRYGHGFLTFYLLEALRGVEDIVEAGKLPIYRLLDYVTERVKAAAQQIGRPQNPTFRGSIDGGLHWPVFVPGAKFFAAFPDSMPAPVTTDIRSLEKVGFPSALVDAWAGPIPSLNALQVDAINGFGVLDGNHLVVSAPTSSGKTLVGELAALKQVLERKRAIFLLPLKALVADKRRHFQSTYAAFGVRTIEATGETDDISPFIRGQYDIALLTYEKFAAVALSYPHVLAQAGVIVVDEAQMIADESRGANLEFVLTLIRMQRRADVEPQIIALSAVIGDTNGLERWLGAKLLRRTERPVPLDEGLLLGDGSYRFLDSAAGQERRSDGPIIRRLFGKGSSQDLIIPLVQKLVGEGQQVIVFREQKGETRGCARYLADALGLPPASEALEQLPAGDPSQASQDLRTTLAQGVAFHNADLEPEERRIVEEAFRDPAAKLRVIAATTTLAMGVNTPASSVIIAGLQHPGDKPYSIAEYKNLVGRAGRLGYAEKGTAYLIAMEPRTEFNFWSRYVTGTPEDLVSRFLSSGTDPRSLIVRVLAAARRATGDGVTADEIIDFLEASFGAFQAAAQRESWRWSRTDLLAALGDLQSHGLIETDQHEAYHLLPLGRLAGESATEVGSIIRLVESLSGIAPDDVTDPALISAAQSTLELDQLHFPITKKSTQKEPALWAQELRNQGVAHRILNAFQRFAVDSHQPTLRAKKAVACLLYVSGQAMQEIEQILTQFGGAFGGAAGPVRAVAARTSDVLPTAAKVAEILHPSLKLSDRVSRLTVRLTYGIPAPAVDLAREAGNELLRGDYCRLAHSGLCEPVAIDNADEATILACVDGNKRKLEVIRRASRQTTERRSKAAKPATPILQAYVG
ncbi:DEAD/DEAH box helicase (plasmid) [Bosea vestrisii]|uniref:DEAD/DEAH box helicase n=1 Tax=Bosea vestrisii TaxID=151416 RepID=UPI0024DF39EB|nr:DEAD/DEAH box helicase [Bosea vestrisii]WID99678.1 DEAD/DEAH box helicase [Bosea vestrisii]